MGKTSDKHTISINTVNIGTFILAAALAVVAIVTVSHVFDASQRLKEAHKTYEDCFTAAVQLTNASDYLASQARSFVATGDRYYLDNYVQEYQTDKHRENALEILHAHTEDKHAYRALSDAYEQSTALADREIYAMRLTADVMGLDPMPPLLLEVNVDGADAQLPDDEKQERAKNLVLKDEYRRLHEALISNVNTCTDELIKKLQADEDQSEQTLDSLLVNIQIFVGVLLLIILANVLANNVLIVRPTRVYSVHIKQHEPLDTLGARELRQVAHSYNVMFSENQRRTVELKHEAETDALTGLLNRGSYDKLLKEHKDDAVLILLDIDLFKDVNDTYGHYVGDTLLKHVAACISKHFRNTDYVCRIGGDEFAVIMTESYGIGRETVAAKVEAIVEDLKNPNGETPLATLSVGIAFGNELSVEDDLYFAADTALYDSKRNGRNRYSFYTAAPLLC